MEVWSITEERLGLVNESELKHKLLVEFNMYGALKTLYLTKIKKLEERQAITLTFQQNFFKIQNEKKSASMLQSQEVKK